MSRTFRYLPTQGIYFRARRARPGAYRHPKGQMSTVPPLPPLGLLPALDLFQFNLGPLLMQWSCALAGQQCLVNDAERALHHYVFVLVHPTTPFSLNQVPADDAPSLLPQYPNKAS